MKHRIETVRKKWRALTSLTVPSSSFIIIWIKAHKYLVRMKDP